MLVFLIISWEKIPKDRQIILKDSDSSLFTIFRSFCLNCLWTKTKAKNMIRARNSDTSKLSEFF